MKGALLCELGSVILIAAFMGLQQRVVVQGHCDTTVFYLPNQQSQHFSPSDASVSVSSYNHLNQKCRPNRSHLGELLTLDDDDDALEVQ